MLLMTCCGPNHLIHKTNQELGNSYSCVRIVGNYQRPSSISPQDNGRHNAEKISGDDINIMQYTRCHRFWEHNYE